jgi:hypothetical protein
MEHLLARSRALKRVANRHQISDVHASADMIDHFEGQGTWRLWLGRSQGSLPKFAKGGMRHNKRLGGLDLTDQRGAPGRRRRDFQNSPDQQRDPSVTAAQGFVVGMVLVSIV